MPVPFPHTHRTLMVLWHCWRMADGPVTGSRPRYTQAIPPPRTTNLALSVTRKLPGHWRSESGRV